MDGRPALLYGAAGAAAVLLHAAPLGDAADPYLYDLVGLSAVVAVLAGVRRHHPARALPWLLLAAGQGLFVLGDAHLVFSTAVLGREPTAPSLTDAAWLPAYPVLAAALLLLLRLQREGDDRLGLVDSLIASTGAALLVWTYVVRPATADSTLGAWERGLAVGYPVLDLLLLGVALRLAVSRAGRQPAQRLLVASMLAIFGGDVVYAQQLLGQQVVEHLGYVLYLLAYVACGAAALHPSMVLVGAPADDEDERPGGSAARLGLLAACSLLAPLVLLGEWLRGAALDVPVLAGSSAALFLLVLMRVSLLAARAEHLAARLATRRGEARFRSLVHAASDVILVVDADGVVREETPSVQSVLGRAPADVRDRPLGVLFPPDDVAALLRPGRPDDSRPHRTRVRRPDGETLVVDVTRRDLTDDPAVRGIVLTVRDVTRRALEELLQHQASHDSLTGLPNRRLFLRRLSDLLAGAPAASHALLYLDLDGFKQVNDTLGHSQGDLLLVAVAGRLRELLRPQDVLCRVGGDEFVALLPGTDERAAAAVAERLCVATQAPVPVAGRTVRTGTSIGIAVSRPGEVSGPDALVAAADTAMYASKRAGRGRVTLFRADMHEGVLRQAQLEVELRDAVEDDRLDVVYQPLVRVRDGEVRGFEALARWTSPTHGVVAPDEFVPLAEDSGLVVALGRQVLARACLFLAGCNRGRPGHDALGVAVNVSVRQLQEPDFVSTVQGALAAAGVPSTLLTLEITESVRLFEGSASVLHRLKAIGVRLALDDFGTGYASLTHVSALPIDELKIDRSFTRHLGNGGREAKLAASVLQLGRQLGLQVVAEGVERPEQARALAELGCDLAQGHLYGRPLDARGARALLAAQAGATPSP